MEAQKKRNIISGEQYTPLFPKAEANTSTIRRNAGVTHTVAFIPKVVHETLDHTKMIAQLLKGKTTYETCSNIWHFVYQHIAYKKDQEGYEQIRSPARTWHDRKKGVDCDCYSVFISSILSNLGIPHILRITKYHRDYFQHIYPVVVQNGKEIVMDCVTDQFNYEVPYSEKKDYPMDLQYLNGFDDSASELGKIMKKKAVPAKAAIKKLPIAAKKKTSLLSKLKAKKASKPQTQNTAQPKPKKKGVLKKVLNKVNKVNPATVLLRNGILAAMKLNVKNIAKRLRWSYLTPEQATQKGIDPQKFQRLVATRQKLEKIFYGAGGNEKNLKKAMLSGKGNSDKAVNGLDGFSIAGIEYMNIYTPLPQLLGRDVYYSENVEGFDSPDSYRDGQLGEPITLATVGAAMGVLAGIVAALKQIGDIFPKGSKGSQDFDEKTNEAAENNAPVPGTTPVPTDSNTPTTIPNDKASIQESFKTTDNGASNDASAETRSKTASQSNTLVRTNESADTDTEEEDNNSLIPTTTNQTKTPTTTNQTETPTTTDTAKNPGTTKEITFWDKNKSWLKPVAIGVGGISLIAIGFSVLKPKHPSNKSSPQSLSGFPKKRKNHKRKSKHKSKSKSRTPKKTAVALL